MSEDKAKSQAAFTENDVIVDDRQKDQDEFSDAFDELVGDKPVEPAKSEDDTKDEPEAKAEADSSDSDDAGNSEGQEPTIDKVDDSAQTDTDTTPEVDGIDYKARSEELTELLAKETQRNKTWNGRIKAANKRAVDAENKVKELEAKLAQKATTSSDDTYEEIDEFLSDFPELKDNVTKLINKEVGKKQVVNSADDADDNTDEPEKEQEDPARVAWEAKLTAAHSDWTYHANSGKLMNWINEQPLHIKPGFLQIYQSGTAEDCIKLLTEYKRATNQLESDDGATKPKPVKKADKKAKIDAMREVTSSGATVDVTKKSDKDMSFDETAKKIGL